MAWDDFDLHGHKGFTGDKPMDEFVGALQRITGTYEERFSRKPTLAELVYPFEKALRSQGVSGHVFGALLKAVPQALSQPLDVSCFEGAFQDSPKPGFYLIERRKTAKAPTKDVIRIPVLEVAGRTLRCHYEIMTSELGDGQAQALIARVLLKDFCDDHYRDKADTIEFLNTGSGITASARMAGGR